MPCISSSQPYCRCWTGRGLCMERLRGLSCASSSGGSGNQVCQCHQANWHSLPQVPTAAAAAVQVVCLHCRHHSTAQPHQQQHQAAGGVGRHHLCLQGSFLLGLAHGKTCGTAESLNTAVSEFVPGASKQCVCPGAGLRVTGLGCSCQLLWQGGVFSLCWGFLVGICLVLFACIKGCSHVLALCVRCMGGGG